MAPQISVVMCCYNAEKYLKESIDSILNQTFKDFEFIIWDDGSTDSTKTIINSYKDARIRYYYHENTGLGMALKLSCEQAQGKYIARMDADDVSLPNRFQTEYDFLESHPDYVLVSSSYYIIDDNGTCQGRSFSYSWDSVIRKVLNRGSCIAHPCTMYRRDVYIKSGGYLPIRNGQDRVLWPKMLKYGKVYNIPEPLLKYRVLNDSVSHLSFNSAYKPTLVALRRKIANDEIVDDEDIKILNDIYAQVKKSAKKTVITPLAPKKTKGKEMMVNNLLSSFLGKTMSQNIIIFIKNFIALIKYK